MWIVSLSAAGRSREGVAEGAVGDMWLSAELSFKPAWGQRVPALHYGRLSNLGMVELTDERFEVPAVTPFEALEAAGTRRSATAPFGPGKRNLQLLRLHLPLEGREAAIPAGQVRMSKTTSSSLVDVFASLPTLTVSRCASQSRTRSASMSTLRLAAMHAVRG